MHMPLYIDVEGKRVAIFGAGMVGERRARLFLDHGARVTIAAKELGEEVREMAKRGLVEVVQLELPGDEDKARRLIRGSWLVVVATSSPEANRIITRIAREEGVMVNNATNSMEGDVIVPFTAKVWDRLHLAATSLGETGIGARTALEEAARCLEERKDLETLYRVMARVKRAMKEAISSPRERLRLYFEIAGDRGVREAVAQGDEEEAFQRAINLLKERGYM